MVPLKFMIRTATRLQQVWQNKINVASQNYQSPLERLAAANRRLHHARHVADKARLSGLVLVTPQLEARVCALVREVEKAAVEAGNWLRQAVPVVPTLAFLFAELRQIDEEFGSLEVDWKVHFVSATTEPITLQDVELGPFAIRFFWERLAQGHDVQCFDIVALEPNSAAADFRVTHPHVKSKRLCAGDAKPVLANALAEARLADAFNVIRSTLRHYNKRSPHIPLEEWEGSECYSCEDRLLEDDATCCEACAETFCLDCMSRCARCGNPHCPGCLNPCAVCRKECCSRCLDEAAQSRRECCEVCRRACSHCAAEVAVDEVDSVTGFCRRCTNKTLAVNDDAPASAEPALP